MRLVLGFPSCLLRNGCREQVGQYQVLLENLGTTLGYCLVMVLALLGIGSSAEDVYGFKRNCHLWGDVKVVRKL